MSLSDAFEQIYLIVDGVQIFMFVLFSSAMLDMIAAVFD